MFFLSFFFFFFFFFVLLFVLFILFILLVGWWGVGLDGWVVFVFLSVFVCLLFVCLLDISSRCLSLQDSKFAGVDGDHPRMVLGKV